MVVRGVGEIITMVNLAIIDKNGRAWCWGNNNNGQLGDNSTTSRLTPVSVLGAVKTFCQISAGYTHTLAIDKYGRAWGWGSNSQGQLGDGSNTQRLTPVSVAGQVKTFCKIKGGGAVGTIYHTAAIDKNGVVWGWGNITSGRLGINKDISEITPVRICNI
jgi:alpha-tubulin suppressor-like RCC1 family protein